MKLYDVITKEDKNKRKKKLVVEEISSPEYVVPQKEKERFSLKKILVIAGAVVFLCILYIAGMKLVRARVIVTERHIPFSLTETELELAHEKEADAGRLSFQAMVVTTEVSREVFGSELRPSTSKSKGQAVLFNEFSKTSLTIKAGTVLTSATGKQYSIDKAATIPGFTLTGTKKTPGTITVSITATNTGAEYNAQSASFTIAGWSGAKAKQVYGRSAGAITGGDAGIRHALSLAERASVLTTLQAQLIERLKRETRAQIPEDLITFPELQVTTIDSNSFVSEGETIKFPAKLKGTMVSYLISRDLLEQAIASHTIRDGGYPHVNIPALSDIAVTPITILPSDPARIPDSISINISGQGTIIAKVPSAFLKESLIGIPRRSFDGVLAKMPEVDTARYVLYPFWAPFFPTKEEKIHIDIK